MYHWSFPAIILATLSGPLAADAIHDAARNNDLAAFEAQLDQGVDVNLKGVNSEAPLILAALAGHPQAVDLLLARGANVNTRNQGGVTPLHAAANAGHLDIVQRLLDEGVDINEQQNRFGITPGLDDAAVVLPDHAAKILERFLDPLVSQAFVLPDQLC